LGPEGKGFGVGECGGRCKGGARERERTVGISGWVRLIEMEEGVGEGTRLRRELVKAISSVEGAERGMVGAAGGSGDAATAAGGGEREVEGIYGEINALVGTLKRCRALGQAMDEAGDRIPAGVLECLDTGENPDLHLRRDIEETQAAYAKTMGQSGALRALERALRAEAADAFPDAYARYDAQTAYRRHYGGGGGGVGVGGGGGGGGGGG